MKLTQEQLAALIAQVFANLIAAGKDPSAITQDDIMVEVSAIIDEGDAGDPAGSEEEGAPKEDEGKGKDPAITPEFITQVLEALKACQKTAGEPAGQKDAEEPSAQKGAAPAPAPVARPAAAPSGKSGVKSPLPGVILDVKVNVGDTVQKGQTVVILEAMKMENNINADKDGKVTAINVSKGESVLEGTDLVIIE